ncbi:MAG: glycosyltransferase [Planctomycetes bacterium]|nr:glycosyltransferase [Planctomycetota bacterium]
MISGRHIVCVASNWSEPPTGKHHIMRRLARDNSVLWINYHASRAPRICWADFQHALSRLRESAAPPPSGCGDLRAVTPLLVPWPTLSLARRYNALRLNRTVRNTCDGRTRKQLWLFTPDVPEIIHGGDWERVVYCCVDEFAAFSGVNAKLVAELERRTMAAADTVITTSPPLYEARRSKHPNVHLVPHGVDFEHFARARPLRGHGVPADVADLSGPVLGYFGLIGDYVDVELLANVASRRKHWNLVLIGDVRADVSRLTKLSNVRMLGRRAYEDLPAYCAAFDAGLIPFRASRLSHAVNPIKLREYLAAGLPVISSPMPAVADYQPAVQFAATPDELVAAVERLPELRESSQVRRIQDAVAQESWDVRVEQLSKIVSGSAISAASNERHAPQEELVSA